MRRISLLPKEAAIRETTMEYGSMTAIGLPAGWHVLVDSRIASAPLIVMGSGRVNSKLRLPGDILVEITHAQVIDGLGFSFAIPKEIGE